MAVHPLPRCAREPSLGWREGGSQADLGDPSDDGEHTLGAPERHPYVADLGASYYKPANGSCCRLRNWHSQASWAQGERRDGEGESEPGYDLPEGDDELCGSEHDGCEPEENDQDLGAPLDDGDQEHWAQGHDGETVDEDGGDEGQEAFSRPISPRRPDPMGHRMHDDARAMARQARDTKARLRPEVPRDPDTLVILRSGRTLWSGPHVTRDGVPLVGCAS